MIRALLVDDDYLVRTYLRHIIDWAAEGIDLYLDVQNGAEALEAIRDQAPNLILLDIAMPVMDGIELIRQVRALGIETEILVLSCHDEYEYVKEAMKLGASEYILKHLITPESLKAHIRGIREAIELKHKAKAEQTALSELAQKGKLQMRQELVRLLVATAYPGDQQRRLMAAHGVIGEYRCAAVVGISLGEGADAVRKICRSVAAERGCEAIEYNQTQYLFLDLSETSSQSEQQRILWRVGDELTTALKAATGSDPLLALSAILSGDGNMTRLLHQVCEAMQNGFYGICFTHYASMQPFAVHMPGGAEALIRCFADPFTPCEEKSRLFGETLDACAFARVQPGQVRKWMERLDDMASAAQGQEAPKDIEACRGRLPAYVGYWKALTHMPVSPASHPAILASIAYINEHYKEPVALNEVADRVGLNGSYLSHLFRKETGVRFSDYLQKYRIDAAKRLLSGSNISVHQIAIQCGFGDHQYFCKLFKKETGMRPMQYRNQSKKNRQ